MNDNEIKAMLARLQQDLSNPSAPTAEWTHAEFIPLDERKKNVKILNTGYWLGNVGMVAVVVYSCLTTFAGATFMQLVLIGLVSFLILASTFSWYKYVLPAVLKREYKLTQYKMDFKKEKLEIWQRGEKNRIQIPLCEHHAAAAARACEGQRAIPPVVPEAPTADSIPHGVCVPISAKSSLHFIYH